MAKIYMKLCTFSHRSVDYTFSHGPAVAKKYTEICILFSHRPFVAKSIVKFDYTFSHRTAVAKKCTEILYFLATAVRGW